VAFCVGFEELLVTWLYVYSKGYVYGNGCFRLRCLGYVQGGRIGWKRSNRVAFCVCGVYWMYGCY